jgi:histidinol dehydrogenase
MLKIYDSSTARQTLLKRIPPDETSVPPIVLDRIEATFGERINAEEAVRRILRDVRSRGDAALREWSAKLDGFPENAPIRVPAEALNAALENLHPETRAALETAAERIREFHRRQPLTSWFTNDLGGTLGQFIRPIQRVGLYVPGGTAPCPPRSSCPPSPPRWRESKTLSSSRPRCANLQIYQLPITNLSLPLFSPPAPCAA